MPDGSDAEEFFEHAPCGLLALDPDGLILSVNQTFLDWTGHAREALVGTRQLDELFSLPSRIYFETHLAPLLRMQGFANEVAVDVVRADGKTLAALIGLSERRDADGNCEGIRAAVFDATDRRAYERELLLSRRTAEQAARAKADFLAMFAHEVRNPLGALVLQAHVLQQRLPPTHAVAMAKLRASLDKVLLLLNGMLDVSRLDSGKVGLEEIPFSFADIVNAAVITQRPYAEKKELPLTVVLDPSIPGRLHGDPVKIEQVLNNLVGNAVKFTDKGSVTIKVESLGVKGHVVALRTSVTDTGIGIPKSRQSDIFEGFVQADQTIGRRFGGTGLGLSISKKLLELLGASLEVESEPGRGSTFSFELRLRVVSEAANG